MSFASPQCLVGVNHLSFARKLGFKGKSTSISTKIGLISEMPSAVGFHIILTNSGIFCALLAYRKDRFFIAEGDAHLEGERIGELGILSVR